MSFDADTQDLIEWYQIERAARMLPAPPFWLEPHIKVTGMQFYENLDHQIQAGPWRGSRLAETLRALKALCERSTAA